MLLKRFADNSSSKSAATKLRRARFQLLTDIIGDRSSVSVLDIGGRPKYWEMMLQEANLADRINVTLVNPERYEVASPNIQFVQGDGRWLPQFANKEFDVVYSNSTIEHVGTLADQASMAREVIRIGKAYCIQTPNRYFPVEPHFHVPFFQFLPLGVRASLLQHFDLGWIKRIADREQAVAFVRQIRLLTLSEFRGLFPDARIYKEYYCGFLKSFVAYSG